MYFWIWLCFWSIYANLKGDEKLKSITKILKVFLISYFTAIFCIAYIRLGNDIGFNNVNDIIINNNILNCKSIYWIVTIITIDLAYTRIRKLIFNYINTLRDMLLGIFFNLFSMVNIAMYGYKVLIYSVPVFISILLVIYKLEDKNIKVGG